MCQPEVTKDILRANENRGSTWANICSPMLAQIPHPANWYATGKYRFASHDHRIGGTDTDRHIADYDCWCSTNEDSGLTGTNDRPSNMGNGAVKLRTNMHISDHGGRRGHGLKHSPDWMVLVCCLLQRDWVGRLLTGTDQQILPQILFGQSNPIQWGKERNQEFLISFREFFGK